MKLMGLFTKCYFGNRRFPRMSKEVESLKFTRINKKIHRTATKWAGFKNAYSLNEELESLRLSDEREREGVQAVRDLRCRVSDTYLLRGAGDKIECVDALA